MLLQILTRTPAWVFGIFVLLLWLGARQLPAHRITLRRITVMPVAMAGLSLFGVVSAFGNLPVALLAWAAAACVLAFAVLQLRLPATVRYDAASRHFDMPGSTVPLALMMGIFFTKYVVGVQFAMHPQLAVQHDVALGVSTLYGVFSGIFAGRALRLWRLAARGDTPASALMS